MLVNLPSLDKADNLAYMSDDTRRYILSSGTWEET